MIYEYEIQNVVHLVNLVREPLKLNKICVK